MYSELARRETFNKWPHMNYKWALPEQMAQAGFYHQPAGTGDDRALCFTCNVCLVCWEPTDEPWYVQPCVLFDKTVSGIQHERLHTPQPQAPSMMAQRSMVYLLSARFIYK